MVDIRKRIIESAEKKLLFTPHSVDQMNKPERLISTRELQEVIQHGKIIEDYPKDKRGHSCLMMGKTSNNRIIHMVCSPKEDYLAIITAYIPDIQNWDNTYTKRKR